MSEDNYRETAARRKRVQTLKKLILLSLFTVILIPFILCVILFVKVHSLNETLDRLSLQLEELAQAGAVQQRQLEELLSQEMASAGGEPAVNEAAKEDVKAAEIITFSQEETDTAAKHKVYLTFDDGPSKYTEDILNILDRYDVKATFFVVGKEDERSREALSMIVDGGHTLGMHSYSHKYTEIYDSEENFAEDFVKIQSLIYETTGIKSSIYRFPGGSSNTISEIPMQEFAEYLDSQQVRFFDWNVSSGDGGSKLLSVDTLVDNCLEGITQRETSIILLHDSAEKRTTVEALPMIIENILALEDTVILPITEDTEPVQHIQIIMDE